MEKDEKYYKGPLFKSGDKVTLRAEAKEIFGFEHGIVYTIKSAYIDDGGYDFGGGYVMNPHMVTIANPTNGVCSGYFSYRFELAAPDKPFLYF